MPISRTGTAGFNLIQDMACHSSLQIDFQHKQIKKRGVEWSVAVGLLFFRPAILSGVSLLLASHLLLVLLAFRFTIDVREP